MKDGESIFSFIKQTATPDGLAFGAPAPAPVHTPAPASTPPPPPPPPSRPAVDWSAKIAALELKIKGLESKSPENAESGGFKPELQASQRRVLELERAFAELKRSVEESGKDKQMAMEIQASQRRGAELERTVAVLKKVVEGAAADKQAVKEEAALETEKLRGEIAILRNRADSLEELGRGLSQANLDGSLYERCMKNIEAGILGEFKERFALLDAAMERISRKAILAQEAVIGNAERLEKLEARAAQIAYLKARLESGEHRFEKFSEVEGIVQGLRAGLEVLENKFGGVMQDNSGLAAEHKSIRSDFESTSHRLDQLTALFNHFRTELSFLLPKPKESVGGNK